MPYPLQSCFEDLIQHLSLAQIPSPRLEARLIISHVLGIDPTDLNIYHHEADARQIQKIKQILNQRISHCPLCKILGHKSFYKSDFKVNQNVLSPRPDTEILVENAIAVAQKKNLKSMVDFGTGSGCILLSILGDVPKMNGLGVDVSPQALVVAKENAQDLGLVKRTKFINASWTDKDIISRLSQKFDLMVSNPPYIPSADILELDPEVKNYDPTLALDGGNDGLRDYRILAELAPLILQKGGYVLLEVGIKQATDVAKIFVSAGLTLDSIEKDLGGIERCVILHN